MRLTDFWERMGVAFGPHADSLAENHVFSELGNRTIRQALAEGEQPKTRLARRLRGARGACPPALSQPAGTPGPLKPPE